MPKIEDPIILKINDGAPRGAHAAQARALRERLRYASEILTLGTLVHFRHFSHF